MEIVWIGSILVTVLICRCYFRHRYFSKIAELRRQFSDQRLVDLHTRGQMLEALQKSSKLMMQQQRSQRALTQTGIETVVHREERARAALRAVFLALGASEEDVMNVMASVDGREEGDL